MCIIFTHCTAQFIEIPGSLKDSSLCVWPTRSTPRSLAWLTGAGVYYVTLSLGHQQTGDSVFVEKSLIPYWSDSETSTPVGMALTEFHCLLLYRDRSASDSIVTKLVKRCSLQKCSIRHYYYKLQRYIVCVCVGWRLCVCSTKQRCLRTK